MSWCGVFLCEGNKDITCIFLLLDGILIIFVPIMVPCIVMKIIYFGISGHGANLKRG